VTLIKSVSGIRGTIGGVTGDNLTPPDIIAFVSAYGMWLRQQTEKPVVVIGRDGRLSGEAVKFLVTGALQMMGIDVVDLDYSTTPTVEMYVISSKATGGIIVTASHNPSDWNALKFLNAKGEFISAEAGEEIKSNAEALVSNAVYVPADKLGKRTECTDAIEKHVAAILSHPLVDAEVIGDAGLHAVVDCINSTGNISIPLLLERLGVTYKLLNDGNYGRFAHNPEPLPEHLTELCEIVLKENAHIGVSIDPDVDRLALVSEDGKFFGEEYTLVCAADYVLGHRKGPLVTNLSSSRALHDLAKEKGVECYSSPVGEVHVVSEMKLRKAVLGGEGNGGIIDPELHYGRDSLIGLALVLMHMATTKKSLSQLRKTYSDYVMVKDKIVFDPSQSPQDKLDIVSTHFSTEKLDTRDGLKVDLEDAWVQLRKSNTEPILRVYAEARTLDRARELVNQVKSLL
jgi:phosphomannomutase